jgi:hypothetical protein
MDGRTDTTKLKVYFRNLVEAPENYLRPGTLSSRDVRIVCPRPYTCTYRDDGSVKASRTCLNHTTCESRAAVREIMPVHDSECLFEMKIEEIKSN